uniref:Uncharacterized protein n=1 Tax=Eutreptiella gymnastica TaxID=73025 RepID=A0A7S1IU99_9EUGL
MTLNQLGPYHMSLYFAAIQLQLGLSCFFWFPEGDRSHTLLRVGIARGNGPEMGAQLIEAKGGGVGRQAKESHLGAVLIHLCPAQCVCFRLWGGIPFQLEEGQTQTIRLQKDIVLLGSRFNWLCPSLQWNTQITKRLAVLPKRSR